MTIAEAVAEIDRLRTENKRLALLLAQREAQVGELYARLMVRSQEGRQI